MAPSVTVTSRKFSINSTWKTNPSKHFYWSIHRTRRAGYFSWNPIPPCSLLTMLLGVYPRALLLKWSEDWLPKKGAVCCPKEWEKMHGRPEHCALWSHRDCLTGSVPAQAAFPRSSQELSKATKGPLTVYTLTIAGEMALRPSCPSSGASLLVTR